MTSRVFCTTKRIRNIGFIHIWECNYQQRVRSCDLSLSPFGSFSKWKKKLTLHQLISCLIFPSSIQSFRVSAKRMDESQFDLFCAFLAFNLSTFRFFPPLFQYHDENSFCQVDSPSLSFIPLERHAFFFYHSRDLFLLILREVVRIFFYIME